MVTHDMRCVAQWASRVLVMEQGKIIFDGLPREFFRMKAILDKNHLGKPPICELSELLWPEWNYTFLSQEEMLAAVEETEAKSVIV
jgi:ABC-type uncharacterized transport system ATPase subunit